MLLHFMFDSKSASSLMTKVKSTTAPMQGKHKQEGET